MMSPSRARHIRELEQRVSSIIARIDGNIIDDDDDEAFLAANTAYIETQSGEFLCMSPRCELAASHTPFSSRAELEYENLLF